jgi:hypothetical protein
MSKVFAPDSGGWETRPSQHGGELFGGIHFRLPHHGSVTRVRPSTARIQLLDPNGRTRTSGVDAPRHKTRDAIRPQNSKYFTQGEERIRKVKESKRHGHHVERLGSEWQRRGIRNDQITCDPLLRDPAHSFRTICSHHMRT